jgi:hypothetical protein
VYILNGVEGVLGHAPSHESQGRRPDDLRLKRERNKDERESVGRVAKGVQIRPRLETEGWDRVADKEDHI